MINHHTQDFVGKFTHSELGTDWQLLDFCLSVLVLPSHFITLGLTEESSLHNRQVVCRGSEWDRQVVDEKNRYMSLQTRGSCDSDWGGKPVVLKKILPWPGDNKVNRPESDVPVDRSKLVDDRLVLSFCLGSVFIFS